MFSKDIRGFAGNMTALRDFVDLIDPILRKRTRDALQEHGSVLRPLVYVMHKAFPDELPQIHLTDEEKAQIEKSIKYEIKKGPDDKHQGIVLHFERSGMSDPSGVKDALNEITRNETRSRLLFGNSLISLISAVEWYFSRMLHAYFRKYPQIAISEDKVFSYEDLTPFTSVDDARQYLIEKKVEDVLRGSFSDWIKYFRGSPKLSMSYLDCCIDDLVETCERRNLLVHNNGVVNNIYVSKVSEKHGKAVKQGEHLSVTREYLDQRINLFERCCILICAELWKQLDPSAEARGTILTDIAFEHMMRGRWCIPEGLSFFVMNDKKLPERDLMWGR